MHRGLLGAGAAPVDPDVPADRIRLAVLARAERGEIGETGAATDGAVAPTAAEVRRFWLAAGLLALTLAAGVLAAAGTVRHPISRMPPYFERDEVPTGEGTATTTPDVR